MSIYDEAPHWCKNAVKTPKGWAHHVTGELLISVPEMDKYMEVAETVETIEEAPAAVETIEETPPVVKKPRTKKSTPKATSVATDK
jgi:hypothetical protein